MFLKTDPKGNYSKAAVFLLVQNDRTAVLLLVHNGGLLCCYWTMHKLREGCCVFISLEALPCRLAAFAINPEQKVSSYSYFPF